MRLTTEVGFREEDLCADIFHHSRMLSQAQPSSDSSIDVETVKSKRHLHISWSDLDAVTPVHRHDCAPLGSTVRPNWTGTEAGGLFRRQIRIAVAGSL